MVSDETGPRVAIWRSGLLAASETFVRLQGRALGRWQPSFVGATRVDSFNADDADVIAYPPTPSGRRGWLIHRLTGRSRRVRAALAAIRPDLVHAHFAGDGWLVSHSARALGIPLVVTLHGYDVTSQPAASGPRGLRYRRNLRTVFRRADVLIAVSGHIRDRAVALGADPAKVRVHHTGVPIEPPAPAAEKRWDVLFVGRFVEKKGIDDLIEALAMIPKPRPKALFIGGGPLEQGIRERAAALGLDATFLGPQDPAVVRRSMAEAKLFVSPSKTAPNGDSEGLPTTILEAASLGLPTVSTRHSGIPEAVIDGETGLLGDEGDRVALADNIRELLADDPLREKMGEQGRRHVESYFDLRKQTRLLEEVYAGVTAR